MFDTLKRELDFGQVAEDFTGLPLKNIGDTTLAFEDDQCPFCGHRDCFRIKVDGENSFAKCFSEDKVWDVTSFVATLKGIENKDAALLLADKYGIKLPAGNGAVKVRSPLQQLFNMAAEYYHERLLDAGSLVLLGNKSPLQYQEQHRKHTLEVLKFLRVGWSDGHLVDYLRSQGVDEGLIQSSGLANQKRSGHDYLPANSFIYPHMVDGEVSHFTFKDPTKKLAYQLPNKFKLNGHCFYNSDSLYLEGPVAVVEGENDTISLIEHNWEGPVVCSNGNISSDQLAWIFTKLADREVVTFFDMDSAGDKYREKLSKGVDKFKSLSHVSINSGVNDIDEYLRNGGDLPALVSSAQVVHLPVETKEVSTPTGNTFKSNITVRNGAYYKIKVVEGEETYIKLGNFTIELMNIYLTSGGREREITVIREDGAKSPPMAITSEAKVSLKPFRTLLANAVDASYYGKEEDLVALWEYIYNTSKEKLVHLPEVIGQVDEFEGWLFGDCFISSTGAVYHPDRTGVMWISDSSQSSQGLKPLNFIQSSRARGVGGNAAINIPCVNTKLTPEEREELIEGFIRNLGRNLGSMGDCVNMVAWCWATVYSSAIFEELRFFPFLFFWGSSTKGKSTIVEWMLNLFDMDRAGRANLEQLNSGVSFSRKLAYYNSLPVCIDEVRADSSIEWEATFRGWYNRVPRDVAAKDGFGIVSSPIRSTIVFSGEDQFAGLAARARCIPVRISSSGRELQETYAWIKSRVRDLPAIGYHWISNYGSLDIKEVIQDAKQIDSELQLLGIAARTAKTWALIASFGKRLVEKYIPEYSDEYIKYFETMASEDAVDQAENSTLIQFWSSVEGLQAAENSMITREHIRREGDVIHLWYAELYRFVDRMTLHSIKERFSAKAILTEIRETPYFISAGRTKMGVNDIYRRVVTLDLTKAPPVVQNIGNFLR